MGAHSCRPSPEAHHHQAQGRRRPGHATGPEAAGLAARWQDVARVQRRRARWRPDQATPVPGQECEADRDGGHWQEDAQQVRGAVRR
eukprot:2412281-Pyramimonas_sp.AAC.1